MTRVGTGAAMLGSLLLGSMVAAPASAAVTFLYGNVFAEAYLYMADNKYSKDSYRTDGTF